MELSFKGLTVKCAASEKFLAENLIEVIENLLALDVPAFAAEHAGSESDFTVQEDSKKSDQTLNSKLSTSDFAAKLGARSGSDLVMAAAAHLHLTRGMEEFRRAEILTEMKGARAFYRASYGGNLSKSLDMLTKSGRLLNPGSDIYTLAYQEAEKMKNIL